jgi:hypothetical protein
MINPQEGSRPCRGRKPMQESRATEFRRKLIEWKQTPESSRRPQRALARELCTSHQLLAFYLKGLEKWQGEECWGQAREIRARAIAEDRPLTQWEDQQARAYDRAALHFTPGYMLRYSIKRMKKDSERGPLCWHDIQSLKMLAPKFPEAQELLEKCLQNGIKKRKRFAEIVRETPRQEGEATSLGYAASGISVLSTTRTTPKLLLKSFSKGIRKVA